MTCPYCNDRPTYSYNGKMELVCRCKHPRGITEVIERDAPYLDAVKDYYPQEEYTVHLVQAGDWGFKSALEGTASAYWGQGKLGNTEYYKLAQFSPEHKGDLPTVWVCRVSDLPLTLQ